MINRDKIKIMTHLAIYEASNDGLKDRRLNKFFKGDYISYQNFITRIGITIALGVFFLLDMYIKIANDLTNIFDLNYKAILTRYIFIWLVIIVFYSFASTIVFNNRYKLQQERIEAYKKDLKELDVFSKK